MSRAATAVFLAGTALAGCRGPAVTVIPESDLPGDVYASPPPTPTNEPRLPATGSVYLVDAGRLAPLVRSLPDASSLPEALLEALLQAPPEPEGLTSAIPPDTRLIEVEVTGDVATVNLSQEFERGGAGRSLALRVAQVVFTLTEDAEVKSVLFTVEGQRAAVVGGDVRTTLERPVTRKDYARFAPEAGE